MSRKRVGVVVFLAVDDNDEGVEDLVATKMVRAALPPELVWSPRNGGRAVTGLLVGVQDLNGALASGNLRLAPTTLFYEQAHLETEEGR